MSKPYGILVVEAITKAVTEPTMRRLITEYEIVDHGIEHEQYFQGCGVSFTKYDECYTGIGNSLYEALEDAAEQIAMSGFELPNDLLCEINESEHLPMERVQSDDVHHYASIRIKGIK